MRVLILVLAAAVVGLAVSVVMFVESRRDEQFVQRVGEFFHVGALIANARASEEAEYRETTSYRQMKYRIEQAPRLPPFAVPWKLIRRTLADARNRVYQNAAGGVAYRHDISQHGWFPLMAPEAPGSLDRVWIISAINPDRITINRHEWPCWRIDLIDPALPAGQDTVVAWLTQEIPVYGLLKWKRAGETWEFQRGKWAPK